MKSTFTKVSGEFGSYCTCRKCRNLFGSTYVRDCKKANQKEQKSKRANRAVREYQKALMEEGLAEHEAHFYYEWMDMEWEEEFDYYREYLLDGWEQNCYEADPEVFYETPKEVTRQCQKVFDSLFRSFSEFKVGGKR